MQSSSAITRKPIQTISRHLNNSHYSQNFDTPVSTSLRNSYTSNNNYSSMFDSQIAQNIKYDPTNTSVSLIRSYKTLTPISLITPIDDSARYYRTTTSSSITTNNGIHLDEQIFQSPRINMNQTIKLTQQLNTLDILEIDKIKSFILNKKNYLDQLQIVRFIPPPPPLLRLEPYLNLSSSFQIRSGFGGGMIKNPIKHSPLVYIIAALFTAGGCVATYIAWGTTLMLANPATPATATIFFGLGTGPVGWIFLGISLFALAIIVGVMLYRRYHAPEKSSENLNFPVFYPSTDDSESFGLAELFAEPDELITKANSPSFTSYIPASLDEINRALIQP